MEYIIYGIIIVVAYWVGWHARGIALVMRLARDPQATIDLLEQLRAINERDDSEPDQDTILYRVETQNDTLYLYNDQTGTFLGQGTTMDQALTHAGQRYPGRALRAQSPKESHQTA